MTPDGHKSRCIMFLSKILDVVLHVVLHVVQAQGHDCMMHYFVLFVDIIIVIIIIIVYSPISNV